MALLFGGDGRPLSDDLCPGGPRPGGAPVAAGPEAGVRPGARLRLLGSVAVRIPAALRRHLPDPSGQAPGVLSAHLHRVRVPETQSPRDDGRVAAAGHPPAGTQPSGGRQCRWEQGLAGQGAVLAHRLEQPAEACGPGSQHPLQRAQLVGGGWGDGHKPAPCKQPKLLSVSRSYLALLLEYNIVPRPSALVLPGHALILGGAVRQVFDIRGLGWSI